MSRPDFERNFQLDVIEPVVGGTSGMRRELTITDIPGYVRSYPRYLDQSGTPSTIVYREYQCDENGRPMEVGGFEVWRDTSEAVKRARDFINRLE